MRVRVGHGLASNTTIHTANAAAWMYTNGMEPANVVMASAILSWTLSARCASIAAVTGWTRRADWLVEAMDPIWSTNAGNLRGDRDREQRGSGRRRDLRART